MSWILWIFVLAGLYFLIIPVRAIVQLVSWCIEQYVARPTEPRHLESKPPRRPPEATPTLAWNKPEIEGKHKEARREPAHIPAKSVPHVRRRSPTGRLLKLLKVKVFTRSYEYWVGLALSEDDLTIKVAYLSKALKLNPTYMAAWGMKGYALLELAGYGEALECFDKCLNANPSAVTWYKKGLCYYHLKRRDEALRCFNKAVEGTQDRQLLEDASRMKKLLEDDSPSVQPAGLATKDSDSQSFQDAPRAQDAQAESQCGLSVQTTASPSSAVQADNDVILVM